jgi:hypothetical protein
MESLTVSGLYSASEEEGFRFFEVIPPEIPPEGLSMPKAGILSI